MHKRVGAGGDAPATAPPVKSTSPPTATKEPTTTTQITEKIATVNISESTKPEEPVLFQGIYISYYISMSSTVVTNGIFLEILLFQN